MINVYNSQTIFYNDAGGDTLVIRGTPHKPNGKSTGREIIKVDTKVLLNCVKDALNLTHKHPEKRSDTLTFTGELNETAIITGEDYFEDTLKTVEIPTEELFKCMGLELRNKAIHKLYATDGLTYLKHYTGRD